MDYAVGWMKIEDEASRNMQRRTRVPRSRRMDLTSSCLEGGVWLSGWMGVGVLGAGRWLAVFMVLRGLI